MIAIMGIVAIVLICGIVAVMFYCDFSTDK